MNTDLLIEHVKEKYNLPPGWKWYRLEALLHGAKDYTYILIKGKVAPLVTRGKYAGKRTNWKAGDPATDMTVTMPIADQDAWEVEWQKRTGKCAACMGSGREIASVGVSGTSYRPCAVCKGVNAQPPTPPDAALFEERAI